MCACVWGGCASGVGRVVGVHSLVHNYICATDVEMWDALPTNNIFFNYIWRIFAKWSTSPGSAFEISDILDPSLYSLDKSIFFDNF